MAAHVVSLARMQNGSFFFLSYSFIFMLSLFGGMLPFTEFGLSC